MELGEYAQALGDFGTCTGLWPEHPWGYFNRGCVLDRMGLKADAIDDYTAALERDPEFLAALVEPRPRPGGAPAIWTGADRFRPGSRLGRPGRRLARRRPRPRPGGAGAACRGRRGVPGGVRAGPQPDPARIRLKWTYGFAVSARLPGQAQEAFDEVLRQDPRHPQALYGRAMLAMNRGDLASALRFFDRALEANPGFIEARRYRAVLLSRRGDWDRATRDINWCLDREPGSGETLYAAACVAARAAEAAPSPRALDQAFDLLERAWSLGSGRRAHEDPDLAVLRRDPRFTKRMTTTLGADNADRAGGPTHRPPQS